eukprot:jgi/Mesvir1/23994/Mv10750-RA.1
MQAHCARCAEAKRHMERPRQTQDCLMANGRKLTRNAVRPRYLQRRTDQYCDEPRTSIFSTDSDALFRKTQAASIEHDNQIPISRDLRSMKVPDKRVPFTERDFQNAYGFCRMAALRRNQARASTRPVLLRNGNYDAFLAISQASAGKMTQIHHSEHVERRSRRIATFSFDAYKYGHDISSLVGEVSLQRRFLVTSLRELLLLASLVSSFLRPNPRSYAKTGSLQGKNGKPFLPFTGRPVSRSASTKLAAIPSQKRHIHVPVTRATSLTPWGGGGFSSAVPALFDLLEDPFFNMAMPMQRTRQRSRKGQELPGKLTGEELDTEYVYNVRVPGMKKEDLKVAVEGNRLVVGGSADSEDHSEGDQYKRHTWSTTKFEHVLTLPADANFQEVSAFVEGDTVLKLHVPKKNVPHELKAEKIPVQINAGREQEEGAKALEGGEGAQAAAQEIPVEQNPRE